MNKIFFISGLGADKRAFDRIEDFNDYQKIFIDWKSNKKKEPLLDYAKRLIEHLEISKNDIIIGLSFGGLIAQVIATIAKPKKIILISSFRNSNDLKPILRNLLNLRFHHLLPNFRINFFSSIIRSWFNVTSPTGRKILNQMTDSSSPRLMKWSMEKIRTSHCDIEKPTFIYNIIGDKDRMLKLWKNENTKVISGGGHFMVYENANEVNKILKEIIG